MDMMMFGRAMDILAKFYLPEGIFLQEIKDYSISELTMTARFNVPHVAHKRIHQPLDYVTCEEYHLCLAQLSYVFIGSLIFDRILDFSFITFDKFQELMLGSKMRLRRIVELWYIRGVGKLTDFELTFHLDCVQKPESRRKFALLKVSIRGTLRGQLEFFIPVKN